LLPDPLRNWTADLEFLESLRPSIPPAIFDVIEKHPPAGHGNDDAGQKYKIAEMDITAKIDDPSFFGPGYVSPFNPGAPDHTIFLIRMFAFCLPLLQGDGTRKVVLDAGCGYAWTTHWMMMSGFEPIGIDISRVYLDIAIQRLGEYLPHVVVGDTENLPLKNNCLDAVLGFDAFHHIPDRPKAMREFDRTTKRGGAVVLSEPGSDHEHAPGVQDVMDKYGTLERGMDLKDVQAYARGTAFDETREQYILKIDDRSAEKLASKDRLRAYSYAPAHIYSMTKR
jgi:ubiquinone/menaquinone biosynthesis C-methylase UbiE